MKAIAYIWRRLRMRYGLAWQSDLPDFPTLAEWLILLIVVMIICGCGYALDTWRMRAEAEDALKQNARIIACLNGNAALGHYAETDGTLWQVRCVVYEKRIAS